MRCVLIYSMGEVIGDGVIKLPFVAGVRAAFPEARITWAAAKGSSVYAGPLAPAVAGLLDEVLVEGRMGARPLDGLPFMPPPFGGRRFELVIDTQDNLRRSRVARRAATRLFVSGAGDFRLSDRRPEDGRWPEAVTARLALLLRLAAGEGAEPRPLPAPTPELAALAARLLPEGPVYVGFAPGAGGADKRWPLERFAALAGRQAARGRTPVALLGPQELEARAAFAAAAPGCLFPEAEAAAEGAASGPLLVMALAGRLAAAVANDAGPGHMLAAGGAPLLSLQRDRRRAVKFRPAAQRLEMLVAEDYGGDMSALPLEAADAGLERLLRC